MDKKRILHLVRRNLLFYLSHKINYPLIVPDSLQINFTFRCNLRCRMCSMYDRMHNLEAEGRPVELDTQVIKKIIREASRMGIKSLILVGGEPFIDHRIYEIVSFANECGIVGVTVVTNGTILSPEIIKKIFASNLANLSISIDAAREETFSAIRGENVLGSIINNINTINTMKDEYKRHQPSIVSVCTIMNHNLEELTEVLNLCRRLRICRVIFQPVVGDNTNQSAAEPGRDNFVSPERLGVLDAAIDNLIEYKLSSRENFDFIANSVKYLRLIKKYFRKQLKPKDQSCYAGFNRLQIVQEGKLYFCVNQEKYVSTFGDIAEDNIAALWFSRKASDYRRLIKKCDSPCLQWCSYRDEFIELWDKLMKRVIFKK